jgi:flagellar protein FlgJ
MQELMKSMRQASMASGLLDNEGSKMGTEMLDTAVRDPDDRHARRPGGSDCASARASDGGRHPGSDAADGAEGRTPTHAATPDPTWPAWPRRPAPARARPASCSSTADAARAAESATGIPANFMVAQAAHESGWGRREIKQRRRQHLVQPVRHQGRLVLDRQDRRGHDHRIHPWQGAEGGGEVPRLRLLRRAFADYAQLMKDSPRYSQVLAKADTAHGFAHGLQKAGYATDPAYADKLTRVINTTLRLQRAGVI